MTPADYRLFPGPTGPISTPPVPTPSVSMNGAAPPEAGPNTTEILYLTIDGRAIAEPRALWEYMAANLPPDILSLLREPDGARIITQSLATQTSEINTDEWNFRYFYTAEYFKNTGRQEVAAYVYRQQYNTIQLHQVSTGSRQHKAYPLVRLSEAYEAMGWRNLAERYRMLTLVEDAITQKGVCDRSGGLFWRLWPHQIADHAIIDRCFNDAYSKRKSYKELGFCPEAVLQDLDEGWGQRTPEGSENSQWVLNGHYYKILWDKIKNDTGDKGLVLERLASYLMSCIPGVTARRRAVTSGTDLDVFCSFEGALNDFRADLGRHWICECKDTTHPVGFADVAKFARVLDASRCKAGVLFAPAGTSGAKDAWYADREITKLFQQHGIAILVVDEGHLERIGEGESFISVLRRIYEKVRHDLWKEHPQEVKAEAKTTKGNKKTKKTKKK